jgi:putative hydrolase of the HAD superfamily
MSPPHPPPIRAVFFDAGNTLLRMDYEAIAAQLGRLGLPVTADAVAHAEWRARVTLDAGLLARRGVSTESRETGLRHVALLLEALGADDAALARAVFDWRSSYNVPVGVWTSATQRAREALALAREAGARTAVISNSNGSVRVLLERLGLTGGLDFVLDSSEVGVEKPDPRIFELALDRAGVAASESGYVGDLYSVDVLGARSAGLRAVLLDPGGYWGPRDCPRAPDTFTAVRHLLDKP